MIYATVAGNIGRDPELKYTPGGEAILEFSIASSRKVKQQEQTTWLRATIWGKRGEALAKHLSKGSRVTVVGEMSLREYQKKDGTKGSSLELRVAEIALQGGNRGGGGASKSGPSGDSDDDGGTAEEKDDIPF